MSTDQVQTLIYPSRPTLFLPPGGVFRVRTLSTKKIARFYSMVVTDDANSGMIMFTKTHFKILELILKFDLSPKFQVVEYSTVYLTVCV